MSEAESSIYTVFMYYIQLKVGEDKTEKADACFCYWRKKYLQVKTYKATEMVRSRFKHMLSIVKNAAVDE